MLAPSQLPSGYAEWNRRWGAPFGYRHAARFPTRVRLLPLVARHLAGMFAFQTNSAAREFEYPWAWDVADIRRGLTCVDVGAGHSGFPFVLSASGADTWLVDPFLQFSNDANYVRPPASIVARMNRAFRTDVRLIHDTLDRAALADDSVDRLFCISALEHMPDEAIATIAAESRRILKPKGHFVVTIDLFLDIVPFAQPQRNQFGRNIDVKAFVDATGLRLTLGRPAELHGYPEFDPDQTKAHLSEYLISRSYPVLTQCLVLTKP